MSSTDLKSVIKEKYGQAALRVNRGGSRLLRRHCGQRLGLRPDHF